jgi:hypothetical protein
VLQSLFKTVTILFQLTVHSLIGIRALYAKRQLAGMQKEVATVVFQKNIRKYTVRKSFKQLRRATILAQARWRGKLARREYTGELRVFK